MKTTVAGELFEVRTTGTGELFEMKTTVAGELFEMRTQSTQKRAPNSLLTRALEN
jgi:hypothetical protein